MGRAQGKGLQDQHIQSAGEELFGHQHFADGDLPSDVGLHGCDNGVGSQRDRLGQSLGRIGSDDGFASFVSEAAGK